MARVIDLKVGYSCNDACIHCVVDDFREALSERSRPQDKTFEEIKLELKDARERGDFVVITGGEPTIRPDIADIFQEAHNLGFGIMMQTNGRRLSSPELADKLCAFGPPTFCIALHGPEAAIHEAITQRKGSFAETVQGISNVVARKAPVIGKIVLSNLNFKVLPEIVAKFADLGVRRINIAFPHAQGRARKLWDQAVPKYTSVIPYMCQSLEQAAASGLAVNGETFMFCHLPGFEHCVAELGQQLEDYQEINQYGSDEGAQDWKKIRVSIKKKFPQCSSCRFDPICEGPWNEYAEAYGGDEFSPVPGEKVRDAREILTGRFHDQFPLAFEVLP